MLPRALNDVACEVFEFCPRELVVKAEIRRQERDRDLGLQLRRESDLRLLGCLANPRENGKRFAVGQASSLSRFLPHSQIGQRLAGALNEARSTSRFDSLQQKIHQALIQIVSTEAGVAVGGQHLKNALIQFED